MYNWPDIAEIKNFFFEAALMTYAGGAPKETVPDLPNSKKYTIRHKDFLYTDVYHTNGEYSGGQTTIYFQDQPVWLMSYQGWCKDDDPKVIALLKEALQYAYERDIFLGGRGPASFPRGSDARLFAKTDGSLIYKNGGYGPIITGSSPFDDFMGIERIERITSTGSYQTVFWHRYQGMLLIPRPSTEPLAA